MVFVAMAGLAPGSFGSSHGVTIANVLYRVPFMIRPTWPCFPPAIVSGRVAVLAYNYWIISFEDSRVLMKNLATTLLIVFGFGIFDIVVFSFLIRTFMLSFSFVSGVVDYGSVFIQLCLKILLVYRRHMLLTLT